MRLAWRILRVAWRLMRLGVGVVLVVIEGVFWMIAFLYGVIFTGYDVTKAVRSWREGSLHCPRGHEIPTRGQTYECAACGFVYEGSMLKCGNPECQSPVTSYIDCPECGLSVRNPWRWGRP